MRKKEITERSFWAATGALDDIQRYLGGNIKRENFSKSPTSCEGSYSGGRTELQSKLGSYPFIPLPAKSALSGLVIGYDYILTTLRGDKKGSRPTFLDAGCGFGNIMLLAKAVGFVAYGLEIDPTSIKYAKIVNVSHGGIKRQNILTSRSYGKFDLVYYYCPFSSYRQERKFEERVEDQMKVGALLMPKMKKSNRIVDDERFKRIRIGRKYVTLYEKIKE